MKEKRDYRYEHKLNIAKGYIDEKKYLHAIQIYNSLLEENPDKDEIYYKLASVYEKINSAEVGAKLLADLLEKNSDSKEIRMYAGHFYFRNSMWDRTVETLSYFLPSEEPITSFFIGFSHFMLNEDDLALNSFENFISSNTNSEYIPDAFIYIAKINIRAKDYDKALHTLNKAAMFYENFYEMHLLFAQCFYYLGMDAHATKAIEKALKLKKKDYSVLEWAGLIYLRVGDYKKAESFLIKAVKENENTNPSIFFNLGITMMRADNPIEAQKYFDKVLELDPKNKAVKEAIKNLSKSYNK